MGGKVKLDVMDLELIIVLLPPRVGRARPGGALRD